MQVNISEARIRLSRLIKSAQAGEEVVIANRGEPVARLVPVGAPPDASDIGRVEAILDWLSTHPLPAYARRTAKEIDAAIKDERDSWV